MGGRNVNPPSVRLGFWHQTFLFASSAVVLLSGALWLLFHYFVSVSGDFGPIPHPLESWWLRVHGLGAALLLIGFGSVLPGHVRRAWHARRNRVSGSTFFAALATLSLSGYCLYYVGGEILRPLLSAGHWLLGLLFPVLTAWHVWRGRVSRKMRVKADEGKTSEKKIAPEQVSTKVRQLR